MILVHILIWIIAGLTCCPWLILQLGQYATGLFYVALGAALLISGLEAYWEAR